MLQRLSEFFMMGMATFGACTLVNISLHIPENDLLQTGGPQALVVGFWYAFWCRRDKESCEDC
jgi:hypothetical protein